MFKHLVLWKFSSAISPDERAAMVKELNGRFHAMVGQVDGLLKAETGLNLAPDSEYRMILYTEFTCREAMEAYQNHPLHLAVKEDMKNNVCGRQVVDYDV